jgi:ribose-phosphate pyrophosphokinase
MRARLAALCDVDLGEVERQTFPDGELYMRIETPLDGRDVLLVGGTVDDAATLELYDLACAIVKYGARRLTLVIPYFGYSTMERATRRGEVVTAKTRARLLSSIPPAVGQNRVVFLDLHAEGIPHYLEGTIIPLHLYAKPLILDLARRLGGPDGFVLACTDAGRAKWVESLANDLGVPASFVFKKRTSGDQTEVTAMSAEVAGKRVLLYDDMIRTGGSLVGAARAYLGAGAKSIAAIATHGLFPGDALARVAATGLLDKIAVTDSHPRAVAAKHDLLVVESVAPILAGGLALAPRKETADV